MDSNTIVWAFQAILSALCVVLWTQLQDTKKKADKALDDLSEYKVVAAEKYLSKRELKDAVDNLNRAFEQHATRIDTRLDKLEQHIMEMKGH